MLNALFHFQYGLINRNFNLKKIAVKKRIIYGSTVLCLLILTQVYWFSKSYDAHATSFDHNISAALYEAGDTISEAVVVEKRSDNYFFVTTKASVTSRTVDTLVQHALAQRNIDLNYEIGVYNAEDDSLVYITQKKASKKPEKDLIIESDGTQKNFAVMFPTRESFLTSQSDVWALAIILVIVLGWAGAEWRGHVLSSKQSILNKHEIQIGNSRLDFHNQVLTIGTNSYQLTYKENKILQLFFENPNQVMERDTFLQEVWEKDGFFVARSMDVFISRIRKHLKNDPTLKIENLRAIGYRLVVT